MKKIIKKKIIKKKHQIFKIPLNEQTKKSAEKRLYQINNNTIDNKTKSNIIEQVKIEENKIQNKKKDTINLETVVCQKYIDSNLNDILETFSNNSLSQDFNIKLNNDKNIKREKQDNDINNLNKKNDNNFFNNIFYIPNSKNNIESNDNSIQ